MELSESGIVSMHPPKLPDGSDTLDSTSRSCSSAVEAGTYGVAQAINDQLQEPDDEREADGGPKLT